MSSHKLDLNIPGLKADQDFIAVAEFLGLGPFKGRGKEKHGPCPSCFKSEKYAINPAKGFSNCFSCGFHPDVIGLVQFMKDCSFMDAVKYLGGDKELSEEDRRAQEKRRKDRERRDAKETADKRRRDTLTIKKIFEGLTPGAGTMAQDYLRGRGVDPEPIFSDSGGWPDDLMFHPNLEAFAGKPEKRKSVGFLPAMVALGRDSKGGVTILHRTYLQETGGAVVKAAPKHKNGKPVADWSAKQMVGRIPADFVGVDLGVSKNIHYVCALSVNPLRGRYRREDPAKSAGWRPSAAQTESGGYIAVGEGLETVISVAIAMANLAPVMVPSLEKGQHPGVLVLADNDFKDTIQGSGERRAIQAFQTVSRRLTGMGHKVRTAWPPLGMDFNDFLLAQDEGQNSPLDSGTKQENAA